MRLATWNCQSGLDSNWDVLEALGADVITVQECGSSTPEQAAARDGWTCEWRPGGWNKGLAVLARAPYSIESREPSEPFAVSTVVTGSTRFRFVGFWAMTESHAGYTYPRQATRVIGDLPDDGLPTVVAGDFNASKSEAHLANVRRLYELGLVSAYHAHHGLDHSGVEAHPTSYFQWQESRPFSHGLRVRSAAVVDPIRRRRNVRGLHGPSPERSRPGGRVRRRLRGLTRG